MTRGNVLRLAINVAMFACILSITLPGAVRRRRRAREIVAAVRARGPRTVDAATWRAMNPDPLPMPHWWIRTRPDRRGIQLDGQGLPPCVEFYVPWWAWPLDLVNRLLRFGPLAGNTNPPATTAKPRIVPAGQRPRD